MVKAPPGLNPPLPTFRKLMARKFFLAASLPVDYIMIVFKLGILF
jgi:hypothetical protein